MKTVAIAIAVILAGLIISGAIILSKSSSADNTVPVDNVRVVDGRQIIEIGAKGGYRPQRSVAKAGLPTTLRFATNNTFDCSSAVIIPSLEISKFLPSNGQTDIDVGKPSVGKLRGSCSMGMYPFEVVFEN